MTQSDPRVWTLSGPMNGSGQVTGCRWEGPELGALRLRVVEAEPVAELIQRLLARLPDDHNSDTTEECVLCQLEKDADALLSQLTTEGEGR